MEVSASQTVLCMDIGTSSIKAGLLDVSGRLMWFMHDPILTDKASLESWDSTIWIDSIQRILLRYRRDNPTIGLSALVLSGNGPTLVPVDDAGQAVGPALLWIDNKRQDRAGNRSFYLPKIAWFRQHYPELYARSAHFLSCPEYLNFLLTGQRWTITPSERFEQYIWSEADIFAYGIDPERLPPWRRPGEMVGRVTALAAKRFRLPEGLPVIAAGSDFMMSLAGTGTLSPGLVCDRAGSSEGINYCSANEIRDQKLRTLPHLVDDCWNIAGILSSTGLMFEWFRGISGQTKRPYVDMICEIRDLPVNGNLPWFIPNHRQASSWEFQRGMFLNLRPEHGAAQLGRAVVESIGFAVRQSIENLRHVGLPVNELRLCGGQAKNIQWVTMKADITGVTMLVPEIPDAELVGNAMMGFIGLGVYGDIQQAAKAMVRMVTRVEPNAERHAVFTSRYADYQDTQDRITRFNNQNP